MTSPTPPQSQQHQWSLVRWLKSTSNRSFIVYPICIITFELVLHGDDISLVPWGAPLLVWGYLQYLLAGIYRSRTGGGGPGLDVPPLKIIDQGIYKYLRNPMYLGHMIFMTGLAITFHSLLAVALLAFHIVWFHRRVLGDEIHLEKIFGADYIDYKARVKRWIPGII